MADAQAAKRYAQAAFELASEFNAVETWRAELADVAAVLVDSQIAPFLADSGLPIERRLGMLNRVLAVSPLVMNLARLLVAKGRSLDAAAVAEAFIRMADERAGIAHATVTTAVELSAAQLQAIEAQLAASLGKQVKTTASVDPAIIGGVVVRVGDKLVDGSVRTRLRRLRKELEGAR
jgi:F-type H+-transporting ATPase subunit delta